MIRFPLESCSSAPPCFQRRALRPRRAIRERGLGAPLRYVPNIGARREQLTTGVDHRAKPIAEMRNPREGEARDLDAGILGAQLDDAGAASASEDALEQSLELREHGPRRRAGAACELRERAQESRLDLLSDGGAHFHLLRERQPKRVGRAIVREADLEREPYAGDGERNLVAEFRCDVCEIRLEAPLFA